MKKLFLLLGIVVFTMSSFSKDVKMEEAFNDACAAQAWDQATEWCSNRIGGCSPRQLWIFTDIAYVECVNNVK